MGCMFSHNASKPFTSIRVVNINGQVEDFEAPVTVGEITGKPAKHILCSSAHLVAFGSNPLRPDDNLEPGQLYFLLPHSIFLSESSATDLATLMMRLRAIANKCGSSPAVCRKIELNCGVREFDGRSEGTGGKTKQCSWKPGLDPIYERSFGRSMDWETMSGSLRAGEV